MIIKFGIEVNSWRVMRTKSGRETKGASTLSTVVYFKKEKDLKQIL